jgi:hypothetical protein
VVSCPKVQEFCKDEMFLAYWGYWATQGLGFLRKRGRKRRVESWGGAYMFTFSAYVEQFFQSWRF